MDEEPLSLDDAELFELFRNTCGSLDFFFRFDFFSLSSSASEEDEEDDEDEVLFLFNEDGVSLPSWPGSSSSILCLISRSRVNILLGEEGSWTDAEQTVTFSSTFTRFISPGFQLFT